MSNGTELLDELRGLRACVEALVPLDEATLRRVLWYLQDRFIEHPIKKKDAQ